MSSTVTSPAVLGEVLGTFDPKCLILPREQPLPALSLLFPGSSWALVVFFGCAPHFQPCCASLLVVGWPQRWDCWSSLPLAFQNNFNTRIYTILQYCEILPRCCCSLREDSEFIPFEFLFFNEISRQISWKAIFFKGRKQDKYFQILIQVKWLDRKSRIPCGNYGELVKSCQVWALRQ